MDESIILEVLKKYFKFDEFKSQLQREAVVEICQSTVSHCCATTFLHGFIFRKARCAGIYAYRLREVSVLPITRNVVQRQDHHCFFSAFSFD